MAIRSNWFHSCRRQLAALTALLLAGCAQLGYYGQAASGHWHLLSQRRPLDKVVADPTTPPALRERLHTARRLRAFASAELHLPDNGSYGSYADLERPYVVVSVFAAPKLSLQLRQWCFPLVGCVSYRGYFDVEAARRFAAAYRAGGDDVYLAPVPAYSTLGWFDDPLLNTFIDWPDGRLAELIFHELAHQRLFIADDTTFNESFATAVGRLGARRWLMQYGTPEQQAGYAAFSRRRDAFLALVLSARAELERLYDSPDNETVKRDGKARAFAKLRERYAALKQDWGGDGGYDHWFANDLNNAKLGSLNAYTRFVPAFEALFMRNNEDFAAFYEAAAALGQLDPAARQARLEALLAPAD